jgi:ABC-type phosphate transport system ATPase subunit
MNPETRAGFVVEVGPTQEIFMNPSDPRRLDYISDRFG